MRLLHTTKLVVEEFLESQSVGLKYAIFSHTWEEEEVTFQDMQRDLPPTHMKGFSKLEGSCAQAKIDGYQYIWIDTCCIDKSSSAEVSEAINSMYRWYKEADICYTYLADVPSKEVEDLWLEDSRFRKSRWFTRGWTLQELIAPKRMRLFSKSWSELGSKSDLLELLSIITSIESSILWNGELSRTGVAQKMSWASKRWTTRVEDTAYSLLGIFDVNMPLLYGEGDKAFVRLQEEILKQVDDESLFAHASWRLESSDLDRLVSRSLLADSPVSFTQSAHIVPYTKDSIRSRPHESLGTPSLMTNQGIQLESFGCPCDYSVTIEGLFPGPRRHGWLKILNCQFKSDVFARPAILLGQSSVKKDHFSRLGNLLFLVSRSSNGKIMIERIGQEPDWWRLSYHKMHTSIFPEFEKLQHRSIYIATKTLETSFNDELQVWVNEVAQPKEYNLSLVAGYPIFNLEKRTILARGGSGLLVFQDSNTGQRFAVALELYHPPLESKDSYESFCRVIELDTRAPKCNKPPTSHLSDSFYDSERLFQIIDNTVWPFPRTRKRNGQSVADMAIQDRHVIRATLALEVFLEREEFSLAIEIRPCKEEVWSRLRKQRVKLKYHDSVTEREMDLGYVTQSSKGEAVQQGSGGETKFRGLWHKIWRSGAEVGNPPG